MGKKRTGYKSTRKYHCPYCDKAYTRMDLIDHIESKHDDVMPEDYTAARVVYEAINKTDHGTCMICKKPIYKWNDKTCRYENLCDNPKCREEVRRIALERHIRVYNKPTLLNEPDHQEKMLASRHISGKYKYSDGTIFTYTGKYEKAALEFMDKVMNIPSKDIQMPGPVLEYEYEGQKHSWITDIYYIPANLIIEVKDGGNNPNNRNMPEYRGKQYAKEVMITELGEFNYLRLTNNDFSQLLEALAEIKYENLVQEDAPKVNFFINESVNLSEEVGGLPVRHQNPSTWIEPCLMNNTFDVAVGVDTNDDVVFVRGINDEFKAIRRKDYEENYDRSGDILIRPQSDYDLFPTIIRQKMSFTEALQKIVGYKFRCIDELALLPEWKYINTHTEAAKTHMIISGIVTENDILAGKVKTFESNDIPLKGCVLLSNSDKGYFIHTPKDYYLSSDFYNTPEDIPQNIIDTMADLYDQYRKQVNPE